jgi:capsular polysaccharide biosynthesis protein
LQTQNQAYFSQLAAEPATITPLDEIDVVRTVPPLTARINPFIRIVIGLAAGVGLAFLAEYLDDGLRHESDLEALHIPVLGVIPKE